MTELRLTFEYDPEKAAANLRKHGVYFEEAITGFFDLDAISGFDADHSTESDVRFINIGMSTMNRLLFVVHNEDEGRIRIISARPATPAERRFYEET